MRDMILSSLKRTKYTASDRLELCTVAETFFDLKFSQALVKWQVMAGNGWEKSCSSLHREIAPVYSIASSSGRRLWSGMCVTQCSVRLGIIRRPPPIQAGDWWHAVTRQMRQIRRHNWAWRLVKAATTDRAMVRSAYIVRHTWTQNGINTTEITRQYPFSLLEWNKYDGNNGTISIFTSRMKYDGNNGTTSIFTSRME